MTHCMRHRFETFGIALLLLLLSGCQGGGAALAVADGTGVLPETDWRTLLLNEINAPDKGNGTFLRDDDAMAEQMLDCVCSVSENNAALAEEKLTENGVNGYAIGASDIRNGLKELDEKNGITAGSETCLVGYAIVPQEQAENAALWDGDMIKQAADRLFRNRCKISVNGNRPSADRVSFAKGKIGNRTFIIGVFR